MKKEKIVVLQKEMLIDNKQLNSIISVTNKKESIKGILMEVIVINSK